MSTSKVANSEPSLAPWLRGVTRSVRQMRLRRLHGGLEQRGHGSRDVIIGSDRKIEPAAGAALQVRSDVGLKLRDVIVIKAVGRQRKILGVEDRDIDAAALDGRAQRSVERLQAARDAVMIDHRLAAG